MSDEHIDTALLAQIIQGEAGTMGIPGMAAVAGTLSCRIWQGGQDMARIAREYYGRAEPSPYAELLAMLIEGGELPESEYPFIYSREDVDVGGYPPADYVIMRAGGGPGKELHLYREWPVETLRKRRTTIVATGEIAV